MPRRWTRGRPGDGPPRMAPASRLPGAGGAAGADAHGAGAPGGWLAELLTSAAVGQAVTLPQPIALAGRAFGGLVVERDFRTASKARLLRLLPGDALYIAKLGDVRHEHAVMCTLRAMNQRWRQRGIGVCGVPVEAVTYSIFPIGTEAGLVEVVPASATLRELAQGVSYDKRHLRVCVYIYIYIYIYTYIHTYIYTHIL